MENNQPTNSSDEPPTANIIPPSLASKGKVIQPISSDLINSSVDPIPRPTDPKSDNNSVPTNYSPDSIYPNVTHNAIQASNQNNTLASNTTTYSNDNNTFLTGSQIKVEKKKLPIGVYIIAGFNLFGFIAGFFDSSQASDFYTIGMLINLLLAIGLILRIDAARKFMIGLSGLILIITVASLLLLVGLQQRIKQSRENYEAAISRIDQNKATTTQKKKFKDLSSALASQEKQAGKAIKFTYFKLGATAIGSVIIIGYLTRPKVKEAFESST